MLKSVGTMFREPWKRMNRRDSIFWLRTVFTPIYPASVVATYIGSTRAFLVHLAKMYYRAFGGLSRRVRSGNIKLARWTSSRTRSLSIVASFASILLGGYFSDYFLTPKNLIADEIILILLTIATISLSVTRRIHVVRRSDNRSFRLSTKLTRWVLLAVFSAVFGGLRGILALVGEIPFSAVAIIVGVPLLWIGMTTYLLKDIEDSRGQRFFAS